MEYLIMLASAFGLGAAHALEPGHGKTVVAAYLVGSRGRTRDAIILGAIVTFTHTSSVILLTVVSMIAAAYLVTENVERWLAIGSGLLVVTVGVWMIYTRCRHGIPAHSHNHAVHGHDHGHDDPPHVEKKDFAPESAASDPGTAGGVGLGSLTALGVSGGIVPCPAALVLIPAAVGLGALLKGLGLIISFSLGLALVLIVIGITTLKAVGLVSGALTRGNWARRVSLASAYFITVLGLALTLKAILTPPHMH